MEMNTANMVRGLNPMRGILLERLLHCLCDGRNHLDMYVENYTGGMWTMRRLPNLGPIVPVLPAQDKPYRVVNPCNYSDEQVSPETAGAALWLIVLSMACGMREFADSIDVLADEYERVREALFDDPTIQVDSFIRITD